MQRRPPFSEHIPGELIKDLSQLQSGDNVYIEFSRKITNVFPKLRKFRGKFNQIKNVGSNDVANFTSVIPLVEELEIPKEYIIHNLQVNEGQVKFGAVSPDKNQDINYINRQRLFGYVGDIVNDSNNEKVHVNHIKLLIDTLNITLKSINKEYVKIYKTMNDDIYLEKMVSSSLPQSGNNELTKYTMSFLKGTKSSLGGKRKKRTIKKVKVNRKIKKTWRKRYNKKTI